jgi:exodeoxyribonuclease V alpha subunit
MYKGINGIDNLNKFLQDIFNPKSKNKKEIQVGDITYRENDKILQLVNMPDEKIFNGDIGTITKIDNKEITILFDVSEVKFTPSQFNKFRHGYAISIHKSQGSEFDTVVIPVFTTYGKMLYRKLYYTAVTRCKKKLILIGDINALEMASKNNSQDIRMTTIKEKIVNKLSYD